MICGERVYDRVHTHDFIPPFRTEPEFFENPNRSGVFGMHKCAQPADMELLERRAYPCERCLGSETLAPIRLG